MAKHAWRRVVAVLGSGLLALGLVACAGTPESTSSDQVEVIRAALTGRTASAAGVDQVAVALNEFATDLYSELGAEGGGKANLVVSPASVAQVLILMLAATDGTTHQQLRDVLHLTLPDERLYPAQAALWAGLTGGEYTLENANWGLVKDTVPLNPDYVELVAEHLGAQFEADSFTDPAVLADRINGEVAVRTHDMISELVESSMLDDPALLLVLLNAVYFKGDWEVPFAEHGTVLAPFTRADGNTTTVSMMSRPEVTSYVQADGYTAVELAYQGGASMVLVLPDPGRFDQVAASLDSATLAGIRAEVADRDDQTPRELRVPQFDVAADEAMDLKPALTALGAPALFTGSWDWTPLQNTPEGQVAASFLAHKAAIRVGEKGTEASAATAAGLALTSAIIEEPITFNRPFLFRIVDDTRDQVLFLGHIGDPRSP